MAWPVNEIVEVKVGYVANSQQCYNVLHYLTSGNSAGFEPAELTAGFLGLNGAAGPNTFAGEWAKVLCEEVTVNRITVQGIFPTRFALQEETTTVLGEVVGICPAQNLQATITKRGDLGNRHNQGSVHVGGMTSSSYFAGMVVPAHITRLFTLIAFLDNVLGDGLTAVEYTPAILNKTEVIVAGEPKFVITGATPITAWNVKDTLRTQRTRNVGKGV